MTTPLFQNVDCLGVHVPNIHEALEFYADELGHRLLWRVCATPWTGATVPTATTETPS